MGSKLGDIPGTPGPGGPPIDPGGALKVMSTPDAPYAGGASTTPGKSD